jgi:alpha-1,3-glucan synthase
VITDTWGINPDGIPDQTSVFGDVDGDSILDRMPPSTLAPAVINITVPPPTPHLGWTIAVNDANLRFDVIPVGDQWIQIAIFIVMILAPILTAGVSVWAFMGFFYSVKFNRVGISEKGSRLSLAIRRYLERRAEKDNANPLTSDGENLANVSSNILAVEAGAPGRRTVLIATMEYDIEDWNIKIKIGGLGVMAQLMGKNLSHQDLIWVVPCVGDVKYPVDKQAKPMSISKCISSSTNFLFQISWTISTLGMYLR